MKVIQVPMDNDLLRAVNQKAKARRSTRAALIRAACKEFLRKLDEQELEQRYLDGYRRMPETPALGKAGAKLAARVWPREDWDEAR